MTKQTKYIINRVKGQALLITIMLVSVALTVVLAMSYTAKTDLQLSKLEEENQRALAAAEAGIEALVNSTTLETPINISSIENLTDFKGQAIKKLVMSPEFVSNSIQPLYQYTLYLSTYPDFSSPSYSGTLTLYYENEDESCSTNAIEITIIYDDPSDAQPNNIKRMISDENQLLGSTTDEIFKDDEGYTIGEEFFKCETNPINFQNFQNAKFLVIRSIFKSTKIGFKGSGNLPGQGSVIESTAETPSGVSKKIQLFQSYPQIPAEFFVTSF